MVLNAGLWTKRRASDPSGAFSCPQDGGKNEMVEGGDGNAVQTKGALQAPGLSKPCTGWTEVL
jgi:hypothetical protein